MNQDFITMCTVGYGCGLHTLNEAYDNLSRHYDAFFKIDEAQDRLVALEEYVLSQGDWGDTIRGVMGDDWCTKEDAKEEAFWESQNV